MILNYFRNASNMVKFCEMSVFCIAIFLSLLGYSESVICFQCADSKFLGDCQSNMKKFENSVLTFLHENGTIGGDHDRGYLKNCTSEWGDYCVIEHYEERITGDTLSFIRGCSKGKTDISVSGFHNFSADNQTACQYYPNSQDHLLACITWCQEDFCNGPLKYIKMVKEYGTSSCSSLFTHYRIYTYLILMISGILLL